MRPGDAGCLVLSLSNMTRVRAKCPSFRDERGSPSGKPQPMLSDEEALRLYKVMRLCRVMDQKALAMQRQGRMVTYVPTAGQEAASVGAIAALRKEDWVVPAFRETPGQIA